MDEAVVAQRLREQRLARLGKNNQGKSTAQKSTAVVGLLEDGANLSSQDIETVADASFLEPDPTSPPNKKQKNDAPRVPLKSPTHILESVSSSSITLGKEMSSKITLHEADEKKLSAMNSLLHSEEVMALASQLLIWSREQVAVSKVELKQSVKLKRAVSVAKTKAITEHQKFVDAEAKLKMVEADAVERENQLKKKISSLEGHMQKAEQGKLDAEANWYGRGLDKRLKMVEEAKMDVTKCMFDYELEEWNEEQARLQNGDISSPIPEDIREN